MKPGLIWLKEHSSVEDFDGGVVCCSALYCLTEPYLDPKSMQANGLLGVVYRLLGCCLTSFWPPGLSYSQHVQEKSHTRDAHGVSLGILLWPLHSLIRTYQNSFARKN